MTRDEAIKALKGLYDGSEAILMASGVDSALRLIEEMTKQADTPQTDVYDYKGNGKWERSK